MKSHQLCRKIYHFIFLIQCFQFVFLDRHSFTIKWLALQLFPSKRQLEPPKEKICLHSCICCVTLQALSCSAAAGKWKGTAEPASSGLLACDGAPHQNLLSGEKPAAARTGCWPGPSSGAEHSHTTSVTAVIHNSGCLKIQSSQI